MMFQHVAAVHIRTVPATACRIVSQQKDKRIKHADIFCGSYAARHKGNRAPVSTYAGFVFEYISINFVIGGRVYSKIIRRIYLGFNKSDFSFTRNLKLSFLDLRILISQENF
jgi:hypothetical protein